MCETFAPNVTFRIWVLRHPIRTNFMFFNTNSTDRDARVRLKTSIKGQCDRFMTRCSDCHRFLSIVGETFAASVAFPWDFNRPLSIFFPFPDTNSPRRSARLCLKTPLACDRHIVLTRRRKYDRLCCCRLSC